MQESRHILTVSDRKKLRAEAVEKIEYLSPEAVAAVTAAGKLIVRGTELFVESLDQEEHVLLISGNISQIIYSEVESAKKLLHKLFR